MIMMVPRTVPAFTTLNLLLMNVIVAVLVDCISEARGIFFPVDCISEDLNPLVLQIMIRHPWTVVIFVPAFTILNLLLMNVIVAVLVDCISEARRNDLELHSVQHKEEQKQILPKVFLNVAVQYLFVIRACSSMQIT